MFFKSGNFVFVIVIVSFLIIGGWFVLQYSISNSTLEAGTISAKMDSPETSVSKKLTEFVFVEDAHNHEVIVLTLDGEVVKRIKVGKEPHDIAVSPDGKFLVTANFGDGTVSLINTVTLTVEKTIKTGDGAHGVVFSPDGRFLFVANTIDDTLSVIETKNFVRQEKITVKNSPEYVGVTKDGERVFTTNLGGNGSVTVLENKGFSSNIIKTSNFGIDPHGWAVSPDGSRVVITNLGSNFTYLLDSETFEETSHIDTGATTEFAAFRDDTELWVTNIGSHYVSVIDVAQNEIIERIAVGETPHGISFTADKSLAFVPLFEPGEVVIIDVGARKIIKKVRVGEELHNSVAARVPYDSNLSQ